MSDFGHAVQTAIYSTLTTPAISGVTAVYDHFPTDPTLVLYPYILIGDAQSLPDDASRDGGISEFFDLHAWSRAENQQEAKEIASTIYDRFHGKSLTVTGRSSCLTWVRNRVTRTEADGKTRRAIITIEAIHRS